MKNDIRKAVPADIDQLTGLFDAYRVFYEKTPDKNAAKAFLRERIANGDSEIFVAVQPNGDIMGFVQLYPLFSSTQMRRFWLLNDLFVAPAFRRQGIAVRLMERAKELCRATNACGMMLETAKTNRPGNKLYPATGFILDKAHNYYTWETEG